MAFKKVIGFVFMAGILFFFMLGNMELGFAQKKPTVLRLAHGYRPPVSLAIVCDKFAAAVNKRAKGRLVIEVYGGGTLGSETSAVQAVLAGNADFFSASSDNFAGFSKAFYFFSLPFMFKNHDHAFKVIRGPIGQEAKKQVESELNIKLMMFVTSGFQRTLGNTKREIRLPADCRGLKMRTTASPIEVAMLNAFGFITTPIAAPEIYMALKQGVVEAIHIQYNFIHILKLHEVIRYISEVKDSATLQLIGIRKEAFDKLDADLQKIMLEEAERFEALSVEWDKKEEADLRQLMAKSGIKVYQLTESEIGNFRELAKPIWKKYEKEAPIELIEKTQEIGKSF